jgi:hypothetical protein
MPLTVDLKTRASTLLADRFVRVSDRAGLSLAQAEFDRASRALDEIHIRLAAAAAAIERIGQDPASELPDHGIDAPGYSKIVTCGTVARYRSAFQALLRAVETAESGRVSHLHRVA